MPDAQEPEPVPPVTLAPTPAQPTPAKVPSGKLPPLRPQPKSLDDLVGRLATGQHNGGRRAPRLAIVWGNVWLGVVMMVGAVVWFVLALMLGYVFFYPPILFFLGFVALLKGLVGLRE